MDGMSRICLFKIEIRIEKKSSMRLQSKQKVRIEAAEPNPCMCPAYSLSPTG